MNKDPIIAEIIQWIAEDRLAENLEPVTLTGETLLLDEMIFDSLKILQFISWLEKKYAIVIGVENMTPDFFATPASIAGKLIEQQVVN